MSSVLEFAALRILSVLCLCSIVVLSINNSETIVNDLKTFNEKRLVKTLLNNYEKVGFDGRPVLNASEKMVVHFGMALIQLIDFDEKNQVLTTSIWGRYQWVDQLLRWDPKDNNGIQVVRFPAKRIWIPDIVLYNNVEEKARIDKGTNAVVYHNGDVLWIPPSILKSSCQVDVTNFPFDQQICTLKFGSWTYDGFKVDLKFYGNKSSVDITDYHVSNEWTVLSSPAKRTVKLYPCCVEPYPDLKFFLVLRRNSEFFVYLLIFPCVLLSCLTLVTFWLPPDAPAKSSLGMIIFLIFFLLLLIMADSVPFTYTSNVPLVGTFYCFNMVIIALSTFLSAIVINISARGDKHNRLSPRIKKIFYVIGRCFCMRHAKVLADSIHSLHPRSPSQELADSCPANDKIEEERGEILRALKALQTRFNDKDAENRVAGEWRVVALILDRLFFCIYVIVIIVAAAALLRSRFPTFNADDVMKK